MFDVFLGLLHILLVPLIWDNDFTASVRTERGNYLIHTYVQMTDAGLFSKRKRAAGGR